MALSLARRHFAINATQREWEAQVQEIVQQFEGADDDGDLDVAQVRYALALCNRGKPPITRDLIWAMSTGSGNRLPRGQLRSTLEGYRAYIQFNGDIGTLIGRHDTKDEGFPYLDSFEMRTLLMQITGLQRDMIKDDDLERIRTLEAQHRTKILASLRLADDSESSQVVMGALSEAISQWEDEHMVYKDVFGIAKKHQRAETCMSGEDNGRQHGMGAASDQPATAAWWNPFPQTVDDGSWYDPIGLFTTSQCCMASRDEHAIGGGNRNFYRGFRKGRNGGKAQTLGHAAKMPWDPAKLFGRNKNPIRSTVTEVPALVSPRGFDDTFVRPFLQDCQATPSTPRNGTFRSSAPGNQPEAQVSALRAEVERLRFDIQSAAIRKDPTIASSCNAQVDTQSTRRTSPVRTGGGQSPNRRRKEDAAVARGKSGFNVKPTAAAVSKGKPRTQGAVAKWCTSGSAQAKLNESETRSRSSSPLSARSPDGRGSCSAAPS